MKRIKIYLSFLAVFALLLTSCSKEENSEMNDDTGKATLSFGAIVQDLANKATDKQSDSGYPECSDDVPAFVRIVLMQGGSAVVGSVAEPYRVDLVAGELFTEEDAALELEPGTYTLDHFSVYNADGDLIWLAPKGGQLAQLVDNPLPLSINLGAGVKKYVDVSVVCYDNRDVNEYGYLFFELDTNEAFEFCFFANYCTPEGRHYPARYSVNISIDGTSIYNGVVNETGRDSNGDLYADALCFALPNLDSYPLNEEYIDYTLTLLDWTEDDDAYGDVDQLVISGSLSRAEVMANFNGNDDVEYEHVRFGCADDGGNGGTTDSDEDGVPDSIDECPNQPGPEENNGCPDDGGDTDSDNDGVIDTIDQCANTPAGAEVDSVGCPIDSDGDGVFNGIDQCPDTASGVEVNSVGCPIDDGDLVCSDLPAPCELNVPGELGEFCFETYVEEADSNGWITIGNSTDLDLLYDEGVVPETLSTASISITGNNDVTITLDSPIAEQDRITAYAIQISPSNDNGSRNTTCWESQCANVVGDDQLGPIQNTFDGFDYEYPFYVKISTISCFTPDVPPGE